MPTYKVEGPDGRTVTLEGPEPPQESDLDEIFASLPSAVHGVDKTKREGLVGKELPNAEPLGMADTPLAMIGGVASAIGNAVAKPFRKPSVAVFDTTGMTKDLVQPTQPAFETGVPIGKSLGVQPFPHGDIPVDAMANIIRGFMTPESIATLGAGGVLAGLGKVKAAAAVPLTLFGLPMAAHAPEGVAQVASKAGEISGTPPELRTEAMERDFKEMSTMELINLLMLGGMGKGAVELAKGGEIANGQNQKRQEEGVLLSKQDTPPQASGTPAAVSPKPEVRGLLTEIFGGVKPTGGRAVDAAGNPVPKSGEAPVAPVFGKSGTVPVLPSNQQLHGHQQDLKKELNDPLVLTLKGEPVEIISPKPTEVPPSAKVVPNENPVLPDAAENNPIGLAPGKYRFNKKNNAAIPAPVYKVLNDIATQFDPAGQKRDVHAFSVEKTDTVYIREDGRYFLIDPMTGDATKITAAGEWSGPNSGPGRVMPGETVPLPVGGVVVESTIFGGKKYLTVKYNAGEKAKPPVVAEPPKQIEPAGGIDPVIDVDAKVVPPSGVPPEATVPEVAKKVEETGPLPPGSPRHDLGNLITILKNKERKLPEHERAEFAERLASIWSEANATADFATGMVDAKQLEAAVPGLMESKAGAAEAPEWVKNISSIKPENRNPGQQERLDSWNKKNGGTEYLVPENSPEGWWDSKFAAWRDSHLKSIGAEHGKDVYSVIEKIAERTDTYGEDALLAGFLLRHFAKPLRETHLDFNRPNKHGKFDRAFYNSKDKIIGNIATTDHDPIMALVHEAAHAATWHAFEKPLTGRAHEAKLALEQLRDISKTTETEFSKGLTDYDRYVHEYRHKNAQEFIAGIFSDANFRQHLNEIKIGPGRLTLWDKVVDQIKSLLGIKPDTALEKAFDVMIEGKKGLGLEDASIPPTPPFKNAKGAEFSAPPPPPDPLPFRYKDYPSEKVDATTPRGMGKVPILARLFDPRSYKNSPEERVILTNQISKYKADTGVALWLEKNKATKRGFKVGDDGKVELANGTREFMSDVIEKELETPGSQPLTREQKQFVETWRAINAEGVKYAQDNGVKFFLDEDGNRRQVDAKYFPRPRIGTEGIDNVPHSIGAALRPGAKQSSFKSRYHETEAQGVANKVKYEPDEYFRAAEWLKSVYRAVADARLAKDPALKGRLGIRMVPSGIHAPGGGNMLMMTVGKGPRYGEGEVFGVPALKGRVFPIETAKKLQASFQSGAPNAIRVVSWVNNAIKAAKFTMDVSAPFNQGLPMMAYRPGRWAKSTALSYGAMLEGLATGESKVLSRYLSKPENSKAARDFVENGGSLVRLQDFLAGAEHGGLIEKIPVMGRIVRASAQSMGTFLSIGKVELYKALEPIYGKGKKAELVEVIDNTMMSGRMEQLGLSQGRALVERLVLNAPSYLRAFGGLTVSAAQGGISGKVALRAIGGLMGVVAGQMYLAYKLQGLSQEEI